MRNARIPHQSLICFDKKPFRFDSDFDEKLFRKECAKFKPDSKAYLCIKRIEKIKTHKQGKYYRGVICERLREHWGMATNEEAHRAISLEHLRYRPYPGGPQIVRSTAYNEWSTTEWEDYMTFLRNWAWETFQVWIEPPNQVNIDALPDHYY